MNNKEKLVRDGIPDLIRASGREPRERFAALSEQSSLLKDKLLEEVLEFTSDGTLEELADVTEVVRAILDFHGWSLSALEALRCQKYSTHGGFKLSTVLMIDEETE